MQQFVVYELQNALLKDSFKHMRPMNNKMKNPYDDGKDFTSVAYAKCKLMIFIFIKICTCIIDYDLFNFNQLPVSFT